VIGISKPRSGGNLAVMLSRFCHWILGIDRASPVLHSTIDNIPTDSTETQVRAEPRARTEPCIELPENVDVSDLTSSWVLINYSPPRYSSVVTSSSRLDEELTTQLAHNDHVDLGSDDCPNSVPEIDQTFWITPIDSANLQSQENYSLPDQCTEAETNMFNDFSTTESGASVAQVSQSEDNAYNVLYNRTGKSHQSLSTVSNKTFKCAMECPLRDVDKICSAKFDHNGGELESEYGDIKLVLPKDAIRKGDLVEIQVAASLFSDDQFTFQSTHDISELTSPFCWVGASYLFLKAVHVEIEHVADISNPENYSLLTCGDNTDLVMRPVSHPYRFEILESHKSLCTFETTHFCSYCVKYKHKEKKAKKEAKAMRKIALYAFQSEVNNGEIMIKLYFLIPLSRCIKRLKKVQKDLKRKQVYCGMFYKVSYKDNRYYFTMSHDSRVQGWQIKSSKFDKVEVDEVAVFKKKHGTKISLKQAEDDELYPLSLCMSIDPSKRDTDELKFDICVELHKNKSIKQSKMFPINLVMQHKEQRVEPIGRSAAEEMKLISDPRMCMIFKNKIQKSYDKLLKLPIKDILSLLVSQSVITFPQLRVISTRSLDEDKVDYLLQHIIIPSLDCGCPELHYKFLKCLEKSENHTANVLLQQLASS